MSPTTAANLQLQYEEVVGYIREYFTFVFNIVDRSGIKHTAIGKSRLKMSINPFHLTPEIQAAAQKFATEQEKSHAFYAAMVSQDQAGMFSNALKKRFPEVNFDQITRFNALKAPTVSIFDVGHMGGLAFGLIGGVFQFLPRLLLEHPMLDVIAFGCYVGAVLTLYPKYAKHSIAKKQHQYETYILSYAAIMEE